MSTMVLMMGIQGSGKSEFCRQHLSVGYVRINLDTLKTRKNEQRLIEDCYAEKKDFAVDNTNPTRADREKYIRTAKENGYRVIGYYMQSKLQECIARNNSREEQARIPEKAIAATAKKFELPCRKEGFDELYYVANDGRSMVISEWEDENEL